MCTVGLELLIRPDPICTTRPELDAALIFLTRSSSAEWATNADFSSANTTFLSVCLSESDWVNNSPAKPVQSRLLGIVFC